MPCILHIIESLERTGTANQLLVLSRGLAERGVEVHVAALRGGGLQADFAAAGIAARALNRRWVLDPVVFLRLQRLVRRLRPDVVHTWDAAAAYYAAAAMRGERFPQRFVTAFHRVRAWKPQWQWAVERRLVSASQCVVVPSEYIRTWCVAHGLAAEKIMVIPPGVPAPRASDVSREELLRELQLPLEARLIGVVGRLVPEKRVKNLIWAADLLRVLHDDVRLLVIGDGPERQPLEQYARLASDLVHIQFLGERPDLWRILPHLDVLWNADEPRGHAIAVLEAMAAGVPVLASDTPFNRELVVDDETGYLIPLNERAGRATRARHADRIFTDGELAARLGAASHRRVTEEFDVQLMVGRTATAYEAAAR